MGYDYDKLYSETPNALGEPTHIFVDFFQSLPANAVSVLDVGCGQGRDALFVARLGHEVTGVDLSPSGISDLKIAARSENLKITGIVADICDFHPDRDFDIVLIDRTLHMLDETPRLAALATLIAHVAKGGWVLIADEPKNIPAFKSVLHRSETDWETHVEKKGYLFCKRNP